jgi:phosphoadenosine phosphosulfate reductase
MSNLDLFSGKDKAEIAIDRLQAFCPPEGYYVAFSGGKDSVVILDLVKRSGVKYDAHYNITGIDPPELYYFIRDNFPEVERHRPETTIWKLIEKKMFPPMQNIRYCCEYLKERGGFDRFVVTGVRWGESTRRSKRKMVDACYKNSRKHYLHAIIDWSDEDVWEYIKTTGIKYCSLYNEGFKRLGCIGCPNGGVKGRERDFKRWPKFKEKYLAAFEKAAKKRLAMVNVNEKIKWTDGESMFSWWMQDHKSKDDHDQTVMFE